MSDLDIRWKQRFQSFAAALSQLRSAVELANNRNLSELERQGLIKAFEFTHELGWNVIKDFFAYQGNNAINGSRDASREAFKFNLITDGEGWMEMILSRNQSSHIYNKRVAEEILQKIVSKYFHLLEEFEKKMSQLVG